MWYKLTCMTNKERESEEMKVFTSVHGIVFHVPNPTREDIAAQRANLKPLIRAWIGTEVS